MTQDQCKMQQALTDVFYSESPMTDELTQHLKACVSCQAHWESMTQIQVSIEAEVEHITFNDKVDGALIREVFKRADALQAQKRNQRQFHLFVIIALCVLSLMVTLVVTGNTNILIYEQIIVTLLGLAGTPFLIRHRLKRGW